MAAADAGVRPRTDETPAIGQGYHAIHAGREAY